MCCSYFVSRTNFEQSGKMGQDVDLDLKRPTDYTAMIRPKVAWSSNFCGRIITGAPSKPV